MQNDINNEGGGDKKEMLSVRQQGDFWKPQQSCANMGIPLP